MTGDDNLWPAIKNLLLTMAREHYLVKGTCIEIQSQLDKNRKTIGTILESIPDEGVEQLHVVLKVYSKSLKTALEVVYRRLEAKYRPENEHDTLKRLKSALDNEERVLEFVQAEAAKQEIPEFLSRYCVRQSAIVSAFRPENEHDTFRPENEHDTVMIRVFRDLAKSLIKNEKETLDHLEGFPEDMDLIKVKLLTVLVANDLRLL